MESVNQILEGDGKDRRRRFTRRQRLALYAASDGFCEDCRCLLTASFHADHRKPHARGGLTDVRNGAALCPACNVRKGARLGSTEEAPARRPPLPPAWDFSLRRWQAEALDVCRARRADGQTDSLIVAGPGSGKMLLACRLMHEALARGITRLVIVVHTQNLKRQWAAAAKACGIVLTADWKSGVPVLPADVHGLVVTYAQLARWPDPLRLLCRNDRVMASLDEVHHCGTSRAWATGVCEALAHAEERVLLSATPWREDAIPIPYVRYAASGVAAADFTYSYGRGLADGVVREAYFLVHGAQVRWQEGEDERALSFADAVGASDQARRLRAALNPAGEFLREMIAQASALLQEMRLAHPRAKALINCVNAAHARAVASLVTAVTGETPTLALSEDSEASTALDAFRRNAARFLVVCRMASEGYDCPNLRVLVWASTTCSELYFRQVVGRLLRVVDGLEYQDAVVFLPGDARLLAMAQAMLKERALALGAEQATRPVRTRRAAVPSPWEFLPLSSRPDGVSVITGGNIVPAWGMDWAREHKACRPDLAPLPERFLAALTTESDAGGWPDRGENDASEALPQETVGIQDAARIQDTAETYDACRRRLQLACTRLIADIAAEIGADPKRISAFYRHRPSVPHPETGLADLTARQQTLMAKLRELQQLRQHRA